MLILKNFPIKELFLRIFAIGILIISLRILLVQTSIKSPSIQASQKKFIETNKEETTILTIVDKLNAHIEEQIHLLTTIEDPNNSVNYSLKNLIETIDTRLESIEMEAKKRKIEGLIDYPKISELKEKLQAYKQALK